MTAQGKVRGVCNAIEAKREKPERWQCERFVNKNFVWMRGSTNIQQIGRIEHREDRGRSRARVTEQYLQKSVSSPAD
jgi:hypothetical protein